MCFIVYFVMVGHCLAKGSNYYPVLILIFNNHLQFIMTKLILTSMTNLIKLLQS